MAKQYKAPTQSEQADFRAFCKAATDRQLEEIWHKEKTAGRTVYADIAHAELASRGIWAD